MFFFILCLFVCFCCVYLPVHQDYANRMDRKNVSEMIYLVLSGT